MSSDYSDITGSGTLIGVKKGVPKQEDSLIRMSLIFPLEGTFMQYTEFNPFTASIVYAV